MPQIIETTLNPLPDSVLIPASAFTGTLVTMFVPDPSLANQPIYFSASGDLTGDGFPEIVITGWSGGVNGLPPVIRSPVYVFSTSASGATMLDAQAMFGVSSITGSTSPRIDDLDHNGLDDFYYLPYSENPFTPEPGHTFLQTSPGQFEEETIAGPELVSHNSTTGDFNGDGNVDVVASGVRMTSDYFHPNFFNSALILYLGDGLGGFDPYAMEYTVPAQVNNTAGVFTSGSCSAMGDFDNDGKSEIVIVDCGFYPSPADYNSQERGDSWIVSDITFGDHEAWGQLHPLPVPYFEDKPQYADLPSFLGAEKSHDVKVVTLDFDNDGLLDILVCNLVWNGTDGNIGGVVQLLHNKGNLQFEDVTDSSLYNFFMGKGVGHELRIVDVNQDGFPDIYMPETGNDIWNGPESGTAQSTWANTLLINDGAGHFVQAMWNEFHEMTQSEEQILPPENFPGGVHDFKYSPYVLPDGRIGFIKMENVLTPDGGFTAVFDFRANDLLYTGPGGTNPALQGAPGFSEYYYLTKYPEVAAAVTAGTFTSGLDHYLQVGRAEGLFAFAPNAVIQGSAGNDHIVAREGNETIDSSAGVDTVDGGAGRDTMKFTGDVAGFTLQGGVNGFVVSGAGASSTLHDVERLAFDDANVAIDLDGHAGTVAKILGVVFGAWAVDVPQYVRIGLSLLDGGMSDTTLMQAALDLVLGPGASSTAEVTLLYTNLVGNAPSQGELDFYKAYLDGHVVTPAQFALLAADHPLNLAHIDFTGLAAHGLAYA